MSSERGLNGGVVPTSLSERYNCSNMAADTSVPTSSAFHASQFGQFDLPYTDMQTSTTVTVSSSPFVMDAHRSRSTTPEPSGGRAAVCQVCGDDSPGIRKHYGAISCEACKCFFRRSVQMSKRYTCNYNGKCPIGEDKRIRHWCQKCRFQKCLEVGMKIEAVKLHRPSIASNSRSSSPRPSSLSPAPNSTSSCENSGFNFHPLHSQSQHLLLPPPFTPDMLIMNMKPEVEAFTHYVTPPDTIQVVQQSVNQQCSPSHTPHGTPRVSPYGTPVPSPSPVHSPLNSPMRSPGSPCSSQMENPVPFSVVKDLSFLPVDHGVAQNAGMQHQLFDPTQARTEEVLDSFKQRIIFLFNWARGIEGFEILFPLDQKALLRSSVVQIVMLGLALRSQKLDSALKLHTGKLLKPDHENAGVAAVTAITLNKLSRAVKVLNVDDREWALLKEILLFNPEATGVGNTEVVREQRKIRHIALLEHTLSKDQVGRFGELLLLLPPLGELSAEVIEQLRLEQVVSEGEVRIDASLLMSVMNGDDQFFHPQQDISWPPPLKPGERSPFQ